MSTLKPEIEKGRCRDSGGRRRHDHWRDARSCVYVSRERQTGQLGSGYSKDELNPPKRWEDKMGRSNNKPSPGGMELS
jgi:hypothetical protein